MIGLDRAAASSPPTPPPAEVIIAYDPASLADPSRPAPAPSVDADEAPRLLARRVALRGTRNLAAGLEGPARSAFEEALRLDPRNRAALAGLGRLDVAAKRFASAIERLTLAVRLEPRDRELHELLATAHGELGHERAAARHLRLAQGGVTGSVP
jgi:tetratricopeptide (TPR) repeat protein